MSDPTAPGAGQRRFVARWLVVMAAVWVSVAVVRWLDDDSSAVDRWLWTALAGVALVGGVVGVRAIRRERHG